MTTEVLHMDYFRLAASVLLYTSYLRHVTLIKNHMVSVCTYMHSPG